MALKELTPPPGPEPRMRRLNMYSIHWASDLQPEERRVFSHCSPGTKAANEGDSGLLVASTQLSVFLNDSTYTLRNQEDKHFTLR